MALFGGNKETKEEKQARKELEMLQKYGLQSLKDKEDVESVRKIVTELAGTGLMEAGAALGGGSEKDLLKIQMYYQRALIEQNFIMIRQLDKIASKLDEE